MYSALPFTDLHADPIVMKTAVSIPDDLFASADELADRLGVSRSELYARAVEEYLAKHRHADVTAQLNAVYGGDDRGALASDVAKAQARSVKHAEW